VVDGKDGGLVHSSWQPPTCLYVLFFSCVDSIELLSYKPPSFSVNHIGGSLVQESPKGQIPCCWSFRTSLGYSTFIAVELFSKIWVCVGYSGSKGAVGSQKVEHGVGPRGHQGNSLSRGGAAWLRLSRSWAWSHDTGVSSSSSRKRRTVRYCWPVLHIVMSALVNSPTNRWCICHQRWGPIFLAFKRSSPQRTISLTCGCAILRSA